MRSCGGGKAILSFLASFGRIRRAEARPPFLLRQSSRMHSSWASRRRVQPSSPTALQSHAVKPVKSNLHMPKVASPIQGVNCSLTKA